MSIKWNKIENEFLVKNYENGDKKDLLLKINRSWDSIKQHANLLGLNRNCDVYRESNMNKLMEDTNDAFYWIGFLAADGHFADGRIRLILSIKDIEHLSKFGKFIETTNLNFDTETCNISLKNISIFDCLCDKFGFTNNKTYSPSNLDEIFKNIDNNLIYSFIVGFIDGDGCIRKIQNRNDCNLTIHLHNSWLENLIYMEDFLYNYFEIKKDKILSKISNDVYSKLIISNSLILGKMKKECLKLNLPIMYRKWDVIDENFVSRYAIKNKTRIEAIELYLSGIPAKEITKRLNLKEKTIYYYIREYKANIYRN